MFQTRFGYTALILDESEGAKSPFDSFVKLTTLMISNFIVFFNEKDYAILILKVSKFACLFVQSRYVGIWQNCLIYKYCAEHDTNYNKGGKYA